MKVGKVAYSKYFSNYIKIEEVLEDRYFKFILCNRYGEDTKGDVMVSQSTMDKFDWQWPQTKQKFFQY